MTVGITAFSEVSPLPIPAGPYFSKMQIPTWLLVLNCRPGRRCTRSQSGYCERSLHEIEHNLAIDAIVNLDASTNLAFCKLLQTAKLQTYYVIHTNIKFLLSEMRVSYQQNYAQKCTDIKNT